MRSVNELSLRERVGNFFSGGSLREARAQTVAAQSIAESYADVSLALEDAGWAQMGALTGPNSTDLTPLDRSNMVRRSRVYFLQDPLSAQAITLYTAYCIGRGLSIKAQSSAEANNDPTADPNLSSSQDNELQKRANFFWEHPDNEVTFGELAQQESSNKLLADGEIFFLCYPPGEKNQDDVTRVRVMPEPLEIADIITDPEDVKTPWYYLRRWGDVLGRSHIDLYPDIKWLGKELPALDPEYLAHYHLDEATIHDDIYVHHVPIKRLGKRGNPLLSASLDWAKVLRKFLEDRASLNSAWARFAWKRTIAGSPTRVGAMAAATDAGSMRGKIPNTPLAATTINQSKGVDWEPVGAQGGAANAYAEARTFVLQFARGVCLPEHMLSDGANGTRATSKSMERPTELIFINYQSLWKHTYARLFAFDQQARGFEYDAHTVRVDAPRISEDDTAVVVDSLVKLLGLLPEFNIPEMQMSVLHAYGVDHPQDLLPAIAANRQALYQQSINIGLAQTGVQPEDLTSVPNFSGIDHPAVQQATNQIKRLQSVATLLTPPADPHQLPGLKHAPQFGPRAPGASLVARVPVPSGTRVAAN